MENKQGFSGVIQFINGSLSTFFKGKELPLTKKVFDQLANWVERQKTRLSSQQALSEREGDGEEQKNAINKQVNSYAIRACLEALFLAYGTVICPEMPSKALYKQVWGREMGSSALTIPKLMFTVLNGGKAAGSKVRFSKFYVILNVKLQDVGVDAMQIYYKISAAIKKAI